MEEPTCINLAERYGHRYRIVYEEQVAEWPVAERSWLARIACRYGHVGVQGGEFLHAFTDRARIGAKLRALPFVERAQGDAEVRIVFHVAHLAEVLAILRPFRRRQGLSEAQRAALDAGRRPFVRRADASVEKSAETAPGSTQDAEDGESDVPA